MDLKGLSTNDTAGLCVDHKVFSKNAKAGVRLADETRNKKVPSNLSLVTTLTKQLTSRSSPRTRSTMSWPGRASTQEAGPIATELLSRTPSSTDNGSSTSQEVSDTQPEAGEFYIQDGDGHVTNEWAKAKIDHDQRHGLQPKGITRLASQGSRIIQDVVLNTFVQYVVSGVNFIGKPEGGQFWVEADLIEPVTTALMGIVPDDTICEIKFTKPRPCIAPRNVVSQSSMTTATSGTTKSTRRCMSLTGMTCRALTGMPLGSL